MAKRGEKTIDRVDAWIHSATGRVGRVTALVAALFGLASSIVLAYSLVASVSQGQIGIQVPLGPRLMLSRAGEEQEESESDAEPEQTVAGRAITVSPMMGPVEMCLFGHVGTVIVYPRGRVQFRLRHSADRATDHGSNP